MVGKTFFLSSEDSSQTGLLKQLETVGPLMIRTVRTQEKKCLRADDFDVRNYTCWYQDYNKDTRAENFIAGGNDD